MCLKAARLAPSAVNAQPYTMWLVTGDAAEKIAALHYESVNDFIADCSTFIVFTEESYKLGVTVSAYLNNQDFRSVDIGIAVAYLTAEATDVGLDSCVVGAFDVKEIMKILGSREKPRVIVGLGHATEGSALRPKKRKNMDDIVKRVTEMPAETSEKSKKRSKKRVKDEPEPVSETSVHKDGGSAKKPEPPPSDSSDGERTDEDSSEK